MPNRPWGQIFMISNMYPSEMNVRFGIFVKKCVDSLEKKFKIKPVVMTRKDRLFPKIMGYLSLYRKIFGLLFFAKKEDLIYVHFPLYFPGLLMPFIWRGIPVVLNFHGSDAVFDNRLKRMLSVFLRPVVQNCDKVIVPSGFFKSKVVNLFKIPEDKCFVYASGGVDPNVFYPRERNNKDLVFGFVSYFTFKKGWTVFLEALSILDAMEGFPKFKAIMVGDGPEKEKIEEAIANESFEIDLRESVNQEMLSKVFSEFSIFIFPTAMQESLGLVGIESMMCGVPVISSRIGGPTGYIVEGENGFFFEKMNSQELAQKIIAFVNLNELERNKMIENCLESAKKYESHKVEKDFLAFMDKLVPHSAHIHF